MKGRVSRRTFLAGVGGSAVSAVVAWELAGLGFRSPPPAGHGPSVEKPGTVDEPWKFAEHDGWLVTVPDKRLLEFPVRYAEGWYPEERAGEATWRWSRPAATVLVPDLGVEATVYVDYDCRADVFRDRPRTITISVGDQTLDTFVADAPGRQRRGVALPAVLSGQGDLLEITLATDRAFVPAEHLSGSDDWRELGLLVYDVEIREAGIPRPG